MTEEEYFLRELLAVLHRDGGHHATEFGLKKSTQMAIDSIHENRMIVDIAYDLCTCKGRYHTEKKMIQLMDSLGVESSYKEALKHLTNHELIQ